MTEDRLPLADLLAKAEDGDFLRSVAECETAPKWDPPLNVTQVPVIVC